VRQARLELVFIVAVAAIVTFPGLIAGLVSDDYALIRGVAERGPFGVWSQSPSDFFRPIISVSIWLDYSIWGLNPLGYHLTNTVVYLLCVILVYFIARTIIPRAAMFCGIVFAVLPIHAEALYWVSGRTDLFATMFFAAAFLFHLRGLFLPPLILFTLALLSKESAIVFPFVILAYDLFAGRGKGTFRSFSGSLSVLVLYVLARSLVVGELIGGYRQGHFDSSIGEVFVNAVVQFFKNFLPSPVLAGPIQLILLIIAASSIVSLLIRSKLETKKLAFCIIAMLLTILPTVTLRVPLSTTFNDRFVFLASVFSALIISVAFDSNRRSHLVLAAFLCMTFAVNVFVLSLNWIQAGRQADTFLRSAMSFDQPLAIVGVPDSYRGAYVFREGLADALSLHGHIGEPPLALSRLSISNLPVSVEYDGRFRASPDGTVLPGDVEPSIAKLESHDLIILDWDALSERAVVMYVEGKLDRVER
jgi:hypothetical protein